MQRIERGDFIKAVFTDQKTGENEWMWVKVTRADDELRVVFAELDNEPIVVNDLHLGMELALSYANIREHVKASAFHRQ